MQAAEFPAVIRFEIFEVDVPSGELRRDGLRVRLPAQSFQILAMLLTRAGKVVTREEIRLNLWPNRTTRLWGLIRASRLRLRGCVRL